MIEFPNISPNIISLDLGVFELTLRWYAVSYIAGFIIALYIMKYFLRRAHLWQNNNVPMSSEDADSILSYLILGVILGGRIGYVLFYNLHYYLDNPFAIIKIWDGGMSFHGGFLGVVVAVILYSRIRRISTFSCADLIALASPPGLFFGRVANFINGELWGKPTDKPWGVIFPGERAQYCEGIIGVCARHPSQLYEAFLEGIVLLLILWIFAFFGSLRKPGRVAGLFFLGYGAARFVVEYFREPDAQFYTLDNPYGFAVIFGNFGLSMGQLLCLPMFVFGIFFLIVSLQKSWRIG